MNKKISILISLTLLIILVIFVSNIKSVSSEYPEEMVEDFNFEVQLRSQLYVINSYKNTLAKGINWDSDTTVIFNVSDEWKARIYNRLVSLDIYKYPENYAPTSTVRVLPTFHHSILFTLNGITTSLNWVENTESNEKEAIVLRDFFDSIYNDLMEFKEVQNLPKSQRGAL